MASNIWQRQLTHVTDECVTKALDACVDRFEWPPEVGEFKQLCASLSTQSKRLPWFSSPSKPNEEVSVRRIIDAGAELCYRLKKIYSEKTWQEIGITFGSLKEAGRKFRADLSEIEMLEFLGTCPNTDLQDLTEGKI